MSRRRSGTLDGCASLYAEDLSDLAMRIHRPDLTWIALFPGPSILAARLRFSPESSEMRLKKPKSP